MKHYYNTGTRIERNVTRPSFTPPRDRRVGRAPRRADNGRNAEEAFNHGLALGRHKGFSNGLFAGILIGLGTSAAIFITINY